VLIADFVADHAADHRAADGACRAMCRFMTYDAAGGRAAHGTTAQQWRYRQLGSGPFFPRSMHFLLQIDYPPAPTHKPYPIRAGARHARLISKYDVHHING
jgi:hypothetical protein